MKDSTKKINYESAQAVKEYLRSDRSGSLYTFTSFFIKNGYIKSESELEHRGGNVFTHCPFHYDKHLPSHSQKREEFATASRVVSVERTLIWY